MGPVQESQESPGPEPRTWYLDASVMSVTVTVTLQLYFLLAIVALIDERSRGTYSIDV